jgi:hypothetical protein
MRQSKDIQYASILENLRIGKITNSEFELLKTQFLSNLKLKIRKDSWRKKPS